MEGMNEAHPVSLLNFNSHKKTEITLAEAHA
jgi:hypothetical protein